MIRYFDYAASTPLSRVAVETLREFQEIHFANPSSSHLLGQISQKPVQEARRYFSEVFSVKPSQIIFTGSGTESDNLAIQGVALRKLEQNKKQQVITTAIEHAAVKKSVQSLSSFGIPVKFLPIQSNFSITESELIEGLREPTSLVSIHHVNNITGAIFNVNELSQLVKKHSPNTIFHTDAIQSFTKIFHPKQNITQNTIDMVSISAHKVGGPKGVGALIILNPKLLENKSIRPLFFGGEQEGHYRSSTQSAGLISAFAKATEESLSNRANWQEHIQLLSEQFIHQANDKCPEIVWNSPILHKEKHFAGILNFSIIIKNIPLASGIFSQLLEQKNCIVSTGSACSSGKGNPDSIVQEIYKSDNYRALSAIRVSFGHQTTQEDVLALVNAIRESIDEMKRLLSL